MKSGGELLGLPAIGHDSGRRIGIVADVLFDDECTRVIALVVRCGRVLRHRYVIGFSDIISLDDGAVAIRDESALRAPTGDEITAMTTNRRSVQGKPVVSPAGRYLGQVADILFDERSGNVVGFAVGEPVRAGGWRPRSVLPADLSPVVGRDVVISAAQTRDHPSP